MIPAKVFFTKGVGRHREQLNSFETALRDAGIEKFNLVTVSSILPPGCEVIPKTKGIEYLRPGEVVFLVMSRNATNEPARLMAASVGSAIPADLSHAYGYLSEHHSFGENEDQAGDRAEDMAAVMLASTLGIEFDADTSWDEREQVFKLSGKIVKTSNITQSALGDKSGLWTSVVSAAVFVMPEQFARGPLNHNAAKPEAKPEAKQPEAKQEQAKA